MHYIKNNYKKFHLKLNPWCIFIDAENSRGEGGASANEESDGEPEKREDHEADFIPMPGKDIVPGKDDKSRFIVGGGFSEISSLENLLHSG